MAIYRIKITMADGSKGRCTGIFADGFDVFAADTYKCHGDAYACTWVDVGDDAVTFDADDRTDLDFFSDFAHRLQQMVSDGLTVELHWKQCCDISRMVFKGNTRDSLAQALEVFVARDKVGFAIKLDQSCC